MCALHPGLVSTPFYAIPISLSQFIEFFYLLVSLLFFGTFSKDVDTTVILKILAYGYITSSNAVLIAIGATKHTARGITNCNPIHVCHLQKLMYIIQIHVKHTVMCLIVAHYALCIRECTTHVCVVLMNNFNSHLNRLNMPSENK